ncbi:hypothetical protein [Paenarthrobacter aurescens]|uniref:hypothetical protein n=1 Tax=Paenarthrobacter aurescens TaxID=43663 RepID=UPI0021C1C4E6|nr:hypothetical protein [Paenarthrobacter aurescens]MCT9868641.1 hypothetical protein [Paenarthrobacter aurescens]
MSEEPSETEVTASEASESEVPAAVEHENGAAGTGDFTTELDPTFVPDESGETPEEKRAREHPEAMGS